MNTNPFVGPQPLSGENSIFGRDRELRELKYLLTSERIVLLYSASGAGKSSLVAGKRGLCDRLKKSFDVWPVTRVSTEAPFPVANRWVWSAINGFEGGKAKETSANWSLPDYAARRIEPDRYPLLIFDQFEEILRLDPNDVDHKRFEFFTQVGELLRDSRVWALFVLREDFVTQCDPYVRMLPTHMQNRYRLSMLDKANARTAILKTADSGGRTFTEAALNKLVDDLAAGTDFVEPVQMQVACHNLCEKVPAGAPPIEVAVIEELGDVTKALRLFYENNIGDIVKKTGVSELRLREWCEHALIINETIRSQVLYDKDAPDALPESAVAGLESCYVIRKENRRGLDWYELSHDRLIRPIQRSNAEWWKRQPPLLLAAKGWEKSKFSNSYLYSGDHLKEVLTATQGKEPDPLVRRFLNACEAAEEDQRKEERSAQELKRWVAAMGVLVGLVVGPTIVTMGALHRLLPPEEWFFYLGRIAALSLAGGTVARAMFHWFQFRSERAAILRKITRKFRMDPSLDALAVYSPAGGRTGFAAPGVTARLSVNSLDPDRLRTLQFAALWVFLVIGSQDGVYQTSELRSLRLSLRKASRTNHRVGLVFRNLSREWSRWLGEFLVDERSARDGLADVAGVLAVIEPEEADVLRRQLVDIARAILRCGQPRFSSFDEESEQVLSSLHSVLAGNDVPLIGKRTKYYQHSKVFTDIDVLAALAKSSLVAAAMAVAYALVQEVIPFAIPSLPAIAFAALLAIKFGLVVLSARLIGAATARLLKEVRNPAADLFVRIVVASVAVYSVLLLFGTVPPSVTVLDLPVTDNTLVNNFLGLPILWGMTIWYGRGRVKGAFCEACGVWCDEQVLGVVAAAPLAQLRPQLEGGELGGLTGLDVYDIGSSGWAERIGSSHDAGYPVDWLRVTIHECPKCRKFSALNVIEVRLARTLWSGRIKTTFGTPDSADVNRIDRLLITAEQRDRLKAHFAAATPGPVHGG